MAFTDWSTTNSENTSVGPINIAEGCPPGNLNDAIREVMAEIRAAISPALDASLAAGTTGAATGSLASIGALGTAADKMIYTTAPQTFAEAALTAFARSLLSAPDAASIRTVLGVPSVSAAVLSNPGYVKFALPGGSAFMVAWGTFTHPANTGSGATYPVSFPNTSFAVISGGFSSNTQQDNGPFVTGASASGFNTFSALDTAVPCWWIAVGF